MTTTTTTKDCACGRPINGWGRMCQACYSRRRRARERSSMSDLFDPEPLLAELTRQGLTSLRPIAKALDVDPRQVTRWRAGQRLTAKVADRVAVSLGTHPGEIWPEWWTA